MTDGSSKQFPYRALGFKLRSLREKQNQSVPDVSGSVEIESELLVDIEKGMKLPSEDILLLLISHFDLQNNEAMKLWRLAGYDNFSDPNTSSDNLAHQPAVFILPIDSRVVYTDAVQVSNNSFGVIINFQQSNQANQQPLTVARVGMSHEQAKTILATLQKALTSQASKKLITGSARKNVNKKDKK